MPISEVVADERGEASTGGRKKTLICFSHLRWDFVWQRPQHIMSRFAQDYTVIFWEEPIYGEDQPRIDTRSCSQSDVIVATPRIPNNVTPEKEAELLRSLLDVELARYDLLVRWYYTPMMLPFSQHLHAECVVYDCMDELANFKGAPPELLRLEQDLIGCSDLVFTGGYSLYESKRDRHPDTHPFPSAVDAAHFAEALERCQDPVDQASLARPRLGFFGVIDERMDLDLLAGLATNRPDWSIIMVGPLAKIDEAELPRQPNIFYLGAKSYDELPAYLSGWDVALMPFAINDATRFISPTKTPEYLAAGRPVVSTPIVDVVRHYGNITAVRIAQGTEAFIAACEEALELSRDRSIWSGEVRELLADMSWEHTHAGMAALIADAIAERSNRKGIAPLTPSAARRENAYDVMVLGAGFAGAVMAERLAADAGKKVLVVDRRPHVGGNAFDRVDDAGILIHQYGPHIFHTNSSEVVDYLSRFTKWRPYHHRVLSDIGGVLVPMPINRTTLNKLYGCDLMSDDEASAFLAARAEPVDVVRTSADVVISAVGRELYETFFEGYTRKQWGMDPSELDKSVTARVPTRTNTDDRYFTDKFQAMPSQGFTAMFEKMLDHPNIDLLLGVEFADAQSAYSHDHLVFTGPIDEFFGYCYGKLPYRSLEFRHETRDAEWVQPVAVVNYPSEEVPFTRVTEYKHLTGQQSPRSSITFEFPRAEGDPYYPIPRPENQVLYKRYEALARSRSDVTFVGRLATYRYYNMDQVVGQALATYRRTFAFAGRRAAPALTTRSGIAA